MKYIYTALAIAGLFAASPVLAQTARQTSAGRSSANNLNFSPPLRSGNGANRGGGTGSGSQGSGRNTTQNVNGTFVPYAYTNPATTFQDLKESDLTQESGYMLFHSNVFMSQLLGLPASNGLGLTANTSLIDGAQIGMYMTGPAINPERSGAIILASGPSASLDLAAADEEISLDVWQSLKDQYHRSNFWVTKGGDVSIGDNVTPAHSKLNEGVSEVRDDLLGPKLFFRGARPSSDVPESTPFPMSNMGDELFFQRVNESKNNTTLRLNLGYDGSANDKMECGFYAVGSNKWTQAVALYANGNVEARKVIVTTNSYPDYVFKPSYRLAPLAEVEQKIKELGHLPGMPSAAEVEAKGMDLGEQNRLLVEKVEELTLHLIQMRKELDELKAARK